MQHGRFCSGFLVSSKGSCFSSCCSAAGRQAGLAAHLGQAEGSTQPVQASCRRPTERQQALHLSVHPHAHGVARVWREGKGWPNPGHAISFFLPFSAFPSFSQFADLLHPFCSAPTAQKPTVSAMTQVSCGARASLPFHPTSPGISWPGFTVGTTPAAVRLVRTGSVFLRLTCDWANIPPS